MIPAEDYVNHHTKRPKENIAIQDIIMRNVTGGLGYDYSHFDRFGLGVLGFDKNRMSKGFLVGYLLDMDIRTNPRTEVKDIVVFIS